PVAVLKGNLAHVVALNALDTVMLSQLLVHESVVAVDQVEEVPAFGKNVIEVLHHFVVHGSPERSRHLRKAVWIERIGFSKAAHAEPLCDKTSRKIFRLGVPQ